MLIWPDERIFVCLRPSMLHRWILFYWEVKVNLCSHILVRSYLEYPLPAHLYRTKQPQDILRILYLRLIHFLLLVQENCFVTSQRCFLFHLDHCTNSATLGLEHLVHYVCFFFNLLNLVFYLYLFNNFLKLIQQYLNQKNFLFKYCLHL